MKLVILILFTAVLTISPLCSYTNTAVAEDAVLNVDEWFQTGNTQPVTVIPTKESRDLPDNRIGSLWDITLDSGIIYGIEGFIQDVNNVGLKWVRVSLVPGTWDCVDWDKIDASVNQIDPRQDEVITALADSDITMIYGLTFWDPESPGKEQKEGYSRFKTEDEIQRYLNHVEFIVHNFKDRIEYYEIWNEPDSWEGTQQHIELADYINLVNRTVPIIREEYPDAKIVVGGACNLHYPIAREYTFGILNSDIMPLVDAVSFHPMYGASPKYEYYREYYYNYPSLIQEIKNVSTAHGFNGEYIAEEMCWRTAREENPYEPWTYSEVESTKYFARGTILNLGLNLTTVLGEVEPDKPDLLKMRTIKNLCTVMAGAKPVSLPIEIQSETTNITSYMFSMPNDDSLIALWTDGVALEVDPGVNANLTLSGFADQYVLGIDVLNGFQQSMVTSSENGNLIIQNLIVRDYPIILHLSESPFASPTTTPTPTSGKTAETTTTPEANVTATPTKTVTPTTETPTITPEETTTPPPTPTPTPTETVTPTTTLTETPTPEEEKKVDEGCIIATSTFGSDLAPEVQFLRNFREETVYSTFAGTSFMAVFNAWYYSWSPTVAAQIWQSETLQAIGRVVISPLLGVLHVSTVVNSAFSFNPELAIVLTGLVASSLIGIIYFMPVTLGALYAVKRKGRSLPNVRKLSVLLTPWLASLALIYLGEVVTSNLLLMAATGTFIIFTITLTAGTIALKTIQHLAN